MQTVNQPFAPTGAKMEDLEQRVLMSVVASAGFSVTQFATAPAGATQPDSIAIDGNHVFVGYENGVAKDGADGKSSTIAEFNASGKLLQTFSVQGHNDGLKIDPATHKVWALQNEDGNPNLVIINARAGTQQKYTFAPPADGGGYDDITFLNGKVFLSESNPQANPNTAPAIVEAKLFGTSVIVTPVLFGNATAYDLNTHQQVMLNLQDPDSMTSDLHGNLVMTSQADDEIITVKHPGTAKQEVTVVALTNSSATPVSVDDTLIAPSDDGSILMTDLTTGLIYKVSGKRIHRGVAFSAGADIGELGILNRQSGLFTPIITGLGSPRGLAFLSSGGDCR